MDNYVLKNPDYERQRWLSYFDLLGTRSLIASQRYDDVFKAYAFAIEEARKECERVNNVQRVVFSDTFIFYSDDCTPQGFLSIESVARWFTYRLLQQHIPLRGAIAFGDFYASKDDEVFFGEALIEAYDFGEAQDWIGFLLCPSTVAKLRELGLAIDSTLNYFNWRVPRKSQEKKELLPELPACILGYWDILNSGNRNRCLAILNQMRSELCEEKHRRKYDNALSFLEQAMKRETLGT